MIEPINFIEKDPFKFTYARLLLLGGSLVLVFGLVCVSQFAIYLWGQKDVVLLRAQIVALRAERQLLLDMAPPKIEEGPMAALKNLFIKEPQWARLIRDLSQRLPSTVWLKSFKAMAAAPLAAKATTKKEKKEADKEKVADTPQDMRNNELTLEGVAREAADIPKILESLNQSPYLEKVLLQNSVKEESGFAFVVKCDMIRANF